MERFPRNAKCHCGSGRKYKRCHLAEDRDNITVAFDNGLVATLASVEASWISTRTSRTPEWLLWLARDAVRRTGEPGASPRDGLEAVLLVVTAGEAILNWLLEPLVSRDEFYGVGGRNGLENLNTRKKWVRLSELLKMKPTLRPDAPPLQPFLDTVDVRNDVMHFKHGKNIRTSRGAAVPGIKQRGRLVIPMAEVIAAPLQEAPGENVEDKLRPERAEAYLATLVALLKAVLPAYPDKDIVSAVQKALTDDLWFNTSEGAALWDVLTRAQKFAEKSIAELKAPASAAQDVAAGALLRGHKLLSGIRLLVSEGHPLEAYLLVQSLVDLATTTAWMNSREENAGVLQKEGEQHTRAWVELVKQWGVTTWPDVDRQKVDALLASQDAGETPPLAQRVEALPKEAQELHEFTRLQTAAATHSGWGLSQFFDDRRPGSRREDVLLIARNATMRLMEVIGPLLNLEGAQDLVDALRDTPGGG